VLPVNGRHLVLVPNDEQHAVVGQRRQDVARQQRRAARHGLHVNDGACNKNNIINFSPVIKMPGRASKERLRQQKKAPRTARAAALWSDRPGNFVRRRCAEFPRPFLARRPPGVCPARPHIIARRTSINTFICGFFSLISPTLG